MILQYSIDIVNTALIANFVTSSCYGITQKMIVRFRKYITILIHIIVPNFVFNFVTIGMVDCFRMIIDPVLFCFVQARFESPGLLSLDNFVSILNVVHGRNVQFEF